MISELKNYMLYVTGGSINLGAFLLELKFTGEDFRVWATFAIGSVIGILTIVKILFDLFKKMNNGK